MIILGLVRPLRCMGVEVWLQLFISSSLDGGELSASPLTA